MSESNVNWDVKTKTTSHSPSGWPLFNFSSYSGYGEVSESYDQCQKSLYLGGKIDPNGEHFGHLKYSGVNFSFKPLEVECNVNVRDINHQSIQSKSSFMIHPSNNYGILYFILFFLF